MHRIRMHKWKWEKINVNLYLYSFFIIDPADHLDTHLSNFTECWLFQTNVSQYFDHPFPDADTSVLYYQKRKKSLYFEKIHNKGQQKQTLLFVWKNVCMKCNVNCPPIDGTSRLQWGWTFHEPLSTSPWQQPQQCQCSLFRFAEHNEVDTSVEFNFIHYWCAKFYFKCMLQSNFSLNLCQARENQIQK